MLYSIKSIARNLSSLGVGFKLALIISGYIGAGSLAKWVVEIWYPFTRRIWDFISSALNFPSFDNVTKDTLTALVFFLPFGISAVFSRNKSGQDTVPEKLISAVLAFCFVYILCKDLIYQIYESFFPGAVQQTQNFDWLTFAVGAIGPILAILGMFALRFVVFRYLMGFLHKIFSVIANAVRHLGKFKVLKWIGEHLLAILTIFQIVLVLSATLPAIFDIVTRAIDSKLSTSIYFALLGMVLVVASVVLSVLRVPKQVRIAAGAALGFLSAAYAYDAWLYATQAIERIATEDVSINSGAAVK